VYGDSFPLCIEAPTCNKEADLGKTRVSADKKSVEFCVLDDNGNLNWKSQDDGDSVTSIECPSGQFLKSFDLKTGEKTCANLLPTRGELQSIICGEGIAFRYGMHCEAFDNDSN